MELELHDDEEYCRHLRATAADLEWQVREEEFAHNKTAACEAAVSQLLQRLAA